MKKKLIFIFVIFFIKNNFSAEFKTEPKLVEFFEIATSDMNNKLNEVLELAKEDKKNILYYESVLKSNLEQIVDNSINQANINYNCIDSEALDLNYVCGVLVNNFYVNLEKEKNKYLENFNKLNFKNLNKQGTVDFNNILNNEEQLLEDEILTEEAINKYDFSLGKEFLRIFKEKLYSNTYSMFIDSVQKKINNLGIKFSGKISSVADPKIKELSELLLSKNFTNFLKNLNLNYEKNKYILDILRNVIRDFFYTSKYIKKQAYKKCEVVKNIDLNSNYSNFLKNRKQQVSLNFEKYFNLKKEFNVGVCFSGGGVRAALMTIAALLALDECGILPITNSMVGLSGSTWTLLPFYFMLQEKIFEKNKNFNNKSKNLGEIIANSDFKKYLIYFFNSVMQYLDKNNKNTEFLLPLINDELVKKEYVKILITRFAWDQKFSLVDIYGPLLGNVFCSLFGEKRLNRKLSEMALAMTSGEHPLVQGSTVSYYERKNSTTFYQWFTLNPFQFGANKIGYIPIDKFGSKFEAGKNISGYSGDVPELPLSYWLGICGSAYNFSSFGALDRIPDFEIPVYGKKIILPISHWIDTTLKIENNQGLLRKATFDNYSFGYDGQFKNSQTLSLVDAGIDFNIPVPILLEEKIPFKLIFLFDSNDGDVSFFKNLKKYCEFNSIKIPDFSAVKSNLDLIEKECVVFNDPRKQKYDSSLPTFFYFCINKKEEYMSTMNFFYSRENAESLIVNFYNRFVSLKNEILEIIKTLADTVV